MRVLLDTSALIYLNDFSGFDEIFTVESVVKEAKDQTTKLKLASLKLDFVELSEDDIREIEEVAKKTNDLEKLSKTDVDVLAAAKKKNCIIISDDRNIQNVAEKMGMKYVSIFNKKITKLIVWKKYCNNCKKFSEGNECSICGDKLIRVPASSKKIK